MPRLLTPRAQPAGGRLIASNARRALPRRGFSDRLRRRLRRRKSPEPAAAQREGSVATTADLPQGSVLALDLREGRDGKPIPRSELMVLTRKGGQWQARSYSDPESNVFHKAFAWTPPGQEPALVTLGGSGAAVKLWRKGAAGLAPVETLWQADFGGKFSRMRDGEAADLDGDGQSEPPSRRTTRAWWRSCA